MSAATPPTGLSYRTPGFSSPKPPIWKRINWRIVIFVGLVVAVVGIPFYIWLDETITGGIHKMGTYFDVNLKAMSTFDMDQQNATMDDIPLQWRNLEGKDIVTVGEMWAPSTASDDSLIYFQLVYSKTKCCFSGPPLAQHFVDGDVVPGAKVYEDDIHPVKVWGKLHVYVKKDPTTGVIKSIYHVDVSKVEPILQ
jgi:hypothetical protein